MNAQISFLDELIIDNFAGGGGASTGIELALGLPVDIAINHDPNAIAMHKVNHPFTRHYCESVWDVDPRKVTQGRPVALAWFSPDCKHFSKAKGGKPVERARSRGLGDCCAQSMYSSREKGVSSISAANSAGRSRQTRKSLSISPFISFTVSMWAAGLQKNTAPLPKYGSQYTLCAGKCEIIQSAMRHFPPGYFSIAFIPALSKPFLGFAGRPRPPRASCGSRSVFSHRRRRQLSSSYSWTAF